MGGLLHPGKMRTTDIGAGRISLAVEHNHFAELSSYCFGVADGWFDDPIGLLARAYILVPPIALGKSLLARIHFNQRSNFFPIPKLTRHHPIGYY